MEPAQLQLALNVVTITAVASLAGYCYLLKKENRKLAAHREAPKPEVPLADAETVELDIRALATARRARWVKGIASSIE